MVKWLMLTFLFVFPLAAYAHAGSGTLPGYEPNLRVGILTNQHSVEISADAKFAIVSTSTAKVLGNFGAKDTVTIAVRESGFTVNDVPVAATGMAVVINKEHSLVYSEPYMYANKRRYRGELSIHRTSGKQGMTVVNTLPMEQYLYGVIKNEISPEWSLEAVKAQAVAARTYALASNNKHKDDGFELCATTDCQVYGGRESEAPKAIEAVDTTRGLVITYKDKLIAAYFHSSSGGYTENSENVWSSEQPYLRGVADFDQNSPYYKWEKQLTLAELNQVISDAGYNIGNIQAVQLSPLATPPVVSYDRGVSGRVKNVYIRGTTGNIQIAGTKIRNLLDLKSTLFDISIIKRRHELVMPVYAGKDREIGMVTLSGKKNLNRPPIAVETNDVVVITGFGWGHGLGLSQWGAKAMAEQGPIGNTEYFKDILKHYYQGVEIKKAY